MVKRVDEKYEKMKMEAQVKKKKKFPEVRVELVD